MATAVVLSERAITDLGRLADFLAEEDPRSAEKIVEIVVHGLRVLENHPLIGRRTLEEHRVLVISRGRTGFVALYEYDVKHDRVLIHALRHQREAGFDD